MWKLVIADDERLIVKGLSKMIDWESLNVEIAGVAYDGEQLKRTIEYADPDIVLTDIMMPYMTGLELLHWYNARGGKAKFIFVISLGHGKRKLPDSVYLLRLCNVVGIF